MPMVGGATSYKSWQADMMMIIIIIIIIIIIKERNFAFRQSK